MLNIEYIEGTWIPALRSGTYVQGEEMLKTSEGKVCCLGVLCDVYDPKLWYFEVEEDVDDDGLPLTMTWWRYGNDAALLPQTVALYVGFLSNGEYSELVNSHVYHWDYAVQNWSEQNVVTCNLIYLNMHRNFNEIADALEALIANVRNGGAAAYVERVNEGE